MWSILEDRIRVRIDRRIIRYSKFSFEHECIIWLASCNNQGRDNPQLTIGDNKNVIHINVSKYILERKLGRALKVGYQTNHTCDNIHGPCINIDHLYEGTKQDNSNDMIQRDRSGKKLNLETALEIKKKLREGIPGVQLAREYKVSKSMISQLKHNKRRGYITLET